MTETIQNEKSKILAIIPCLNEEAYLASLVDYLVADAVATSLPLQIAVVDGGSSDKTLSIAKELCSRYPSVTLLHNPAKIQSAAINLAVSQLGTDNGFFIRIDAHAGYPQGFCTTLMAEQKKMNAASVVVVMDTIGTAGFQKSVAAAQNSKLGNGGAAHRNASADGEWVDHGHHALMSIDSFRAVGGYDETFSHNEDAELDIRLRKAGNKIWLTGKTKILYYPRAAAWPLFRQYFFFGRGRARTIIKHRVMPRLRQLAPTAVAPAVLLALISPFIGVAALPLLAWATICLVYGGILALRAGDIRLATAGSAIMIMHFGWSLGFWIGIAGFLIHKKAVS